MADSLQLRIVTPSRKLVDERVREVTAPGTVGEFGVLPDHVAFLTTLEIGTMSYRTEHGQRRIAVRGGFAEVLDNVMTVLADDAVFGEDVNAAAAQTDLRTAEAELQQLSPPDEGFAAADATRRWARARLESASGARAS
jgi:F-type H+-transporting ATPase subunit epsilon